MYSESSVLKQSHISEGFVCNLNDCTGCLLCKVACPKGAISVVQDEYKHAIPRIDASKCVECHRCEHVCPSINPTHFNEPPSYCYAAWNKNKNERHTSASGGLSFIISKAFVVAGGVFVGCESSNEGVRHTLCRQTDGLNKYQGSKYVQSNIEDVFSQIKKLLDAGEKVLFAGTPCQVAAIKSYLSKDFDGFYSVDLVCHGVPSPLLRKEWMEYKTKESGNEVVDMKFRVKNPDQHCTAIQYYYKDKSSLKVPLPNDVYFLSFVYNYTLRKSCYNCKYAKLERVGDITLADFWGYEPKSLKYKSYRKGTSMMLINSSKGEYLFNLIKGDVILDKRSIQEAINGNLNLSAPQSMPDNHNVFWEKIHTKGFQGIKTDFFPSFIMTNPSIKDDIRTLAIILLPDRLKESIRNIKKVLFK